MLGRAREFYKAKDSKEELALVAADMIKEQALSHIGRGYRIAKFFLWVGIIVSGLIALAGVYFGFTQNGGFYWLTGIFGGLAGIAVWVLSIVKRRLAELRAAGLEVVQKGVACVKAEMAERKAGAEELPPPPDPTL